MAASVALLGLCGLACGLGGKIGEKIAEKSVESLTGGEVDLGDVDLSDMPATLRYPNSRGIGRSTWSDASLGGTGTIYLLQTSDDLSMVSGWYKSSLSSWQSSVNSLSGDTWQYMASSPDGVELANIAANWTGAEGKTHISVSWIRNPAAARPAETSASSSSDPGSSSTRGSGGKLRKIGKGRKR
jgi:hypothetical protein